MNKNNIKKRKYEAIFSLGEACSCATNLKLNYLRRFSGPFDWCYGANLPLRLSYVLEDFKDFFNQEDFICAGIATNNMAYRNKRTTITYNHDFSKEGEFSEEYPMIFQKYQRRTQRMLSYLKSGKPVLLVYQSLPQIQNIKTLGLRDEKSIIECAQQLSIKYPNADLLYVRHNEELKDKEIAYKQPLSNLIIADCFNYRKEHISPDGNNCNPQNLKCLYSYVRVKDMLKNKYFIDKKDILKKIKRVFYYHNIHRQYIRILCFKIKRKN